MTDSFMSARRAQALEAALKLAKPGTHAWELIQFAEEIDAYLYPKSETKVEPKEKVNYFNALFEERYPHQQVILNALCKNNDLLVLTAAENGITTIISHYVQEQLNKNPGVYIRIITSSENKKDYEEAFKWSIRSEAIKLDNGSLLEIDTFTSYREKSSKENTDILIIDEMDILPYAYEENIMSVISDMKDSGGKVFIFGCAGGRLFKSLWDNSTAKLILPWFIHPDREEAWGKNTKKQIGEKAFARDYECKWD